MTKVQIQSKINFTTHHIFLTECKTFSLGEFNSWLTKRTIKAQGWQTHPGGPATAQTYGTNQWWTSRNSYIWSQPGTQRSEGRKLPTTQTMESHSYPSKFRPKPSSLGTHMAHTHTQGRHSYPRGLVIASPTRRPEHNDSHYYGHSSRTFCNSLSQDTNFFPQKHNLMKSYNPYNYILVSQRSSISQTKHSQRET